MCDTSLEFKILHDCADHQLMAKGTTGITLILDWLLADKDSTQMFTGSHDSALKTII